MVNLKEKVRTKLNSVFKLDKENYSYSIEGTGTIYLTVDKLTIHSKGYRYLRVYYDRIFRLEPSLKQYCNKGK